MNKEEHQKYAFNVNIDHYYSLRHSLTKNINKCQWKIVIKVMCMPRMIKCIYLHSKTHSIVHACWCKKKHNLQVSPVVGTDLPHSSVENISINTIGAYQLSHRSIEMCVLIFNFMVISAINIVSGRYSHTYHVLMIHTLCCSPGDRVSSMLLINMMLLGGCVEHYIYIVS